MKIFVKMLSQKSSLFFNATQLVRLKSTSSSKDLLVLSTKNKVTTVTMNNPKKLNGWTVAMCNSMFETFDKLANDDQTKVMILTGSDPYYSAGAALSENITPMHPRKLHNMIVDNNEKLFNTFLDFPKPILVAANGPAIGATVTSAALCDGILASEQATFITPFARLCVSAEGCSSVHFERMMGQEAAERMLLRGEKISAAEALNIGLVSEVVTHTELLARAQQLAETWVSQGRRRTIPGNQDVSEYKKVNRRESVQVADSFLSHNFLDNQVTFLRSKGKGREARVFWILKTLRHIWSKLL